MAKLLEAQIHEETKLWSLIVLCLSRSMYARKKQWREENRVRKTEDSSCSLPSHFWSTSRSPFSTCCIPFQSSGSQESNASNCVRFGAEMRKIWPSEDNCIKLRDNFSRWKSRCEFLSLKCGNFAHLKPTCENWIFLPTLFLLIFLCLNFHFLLIFSHSCNSLARKYPRKGKITFLYKFSLVITEEESFGELSPGDQCKLVT